MRDIASMLKEISPEQLSDAVGKAKAYMNTEEGKQMMEKLKKGRPIEGLPVTTDEQNQLIAQLTQNPQTAKQLAALLGKK